MGHTYAEMFPERVDAENQLDARRDKIWDKIKNQSLVNFSVEDLDFILDLLNVERKMGSDTTIYDADLARMEWKFLGIKPDKKKDS